MGRLVYAINTSLDGFIEDVNGNFDWSVPDDELHEFYNDMMRPIGMQLLGRRMYETMAVWETDTSLAQESEVLADFADAWKDSDKVVYSTTLTGPVTTRTRIVPDATSVPSGALVCLMRMSLRRSSRISPILRVHHSAIWTVSR